MELWIKILFAVLMLPGVFAMITPMIPGIPYMFLLSVVYAFIDKFQTFHWWYLAIFGGILILGGLVDYFSGIIAARYGGASKKSAWFGLIGLIVGMMLFPPFGAFLGLFVGVFLGEFFQFGIKIKALKAAGASVIGSLIGVLINLTLAIGFYITFLVLIF